MNCTNLSAILFLLRLQQFVAVDSPTIKRQSCKQFSTVDDAKDVKLFKRKPMISTPSTKRVRKRLN